jgi:uncharacterized protein
VPNVIADTSCIQYLYQINLLNLLPVLYRQITIPAAVATELAQGRALGISLPDPVTLAWLAIAQVSLTQLIPTIPNLGMGEWEVISLSQATPNSLAILDDGLARAYAKQLNVSFTGTLGILLKAKQAGHISAIKPLLNQLDAIGFRLNATTRQTVIQLAGEIL